MSTLSVQLQWNLSHTRSFWQGIEWAQCICSIWELVRRSLLPLWWFRVRTRRNWTALLPLQIIQHKSISWVVSTNLKPLILIFSTLQVLAGTEEGSITVYDLRSPNFPASYLCAHSQAITEMLFHPTQPDKFFTASDDGELWKWTQNAQRQVRENLTQNTNEAGNPWLNGERAKKYVNISTVLSGLRRSITSLDCSRQNRLVCASNNEAVYMIDNILTN